jgi:hypothetical protein
LCSRNGGLHPITLPLSSSQGAMMTKKLRWSWTARFNLGDDDDNNATDRLEFNVFGDFYLFLTGILFKSVNLSQIEMKKSPSFM